MGWKRVVEHALRDYGFGANAVSTIVAGLIEEEQPPKVVGRCIEISDGRRCEQVVGHIGMHVRSGDTWPPDVVANERCTAIHRIGEAELQCIYATGHAGRHRDIHGRWFEQQLDSGIKPKITTCYVVEQRDPFGMWARYDSPNYSIHDARDERDAAADTIDRDRLRIVRVTETREVVE